jgi:hypothetical protein
MNGVQRTKYVEGYTLGNVCTNKQFAIYAKDRATLSEFVEHLLITNRVKVNTTDEGTSHQLKLAL